MCNIKLKPCPFCGGEAEAQNRGIVWVVICKNCETVTTFMPTAQRAADIWNRRDKSTHWHIKPKFKPCPFCGNTVPKFYRSYGKRQYTVRGVDIYCGVHTPFQDAKKQAKEFWDRRVEDEQN